MNETMQKIPGIGDIPILGYLFKSKAAQKNRTELVVMITPEILREGSPGVTNALPKLGEPFMSPLDDKKSIAPPPPAFVPGTPISTTAPVTTVPTAALPAAGPVLGDCAEVRAGAVDHFGHRTAGHRRQSPDAAAGGHRASRTATAAPAETPAPATEAAPAADEGAPVKSEASVRDRRQRRDARLVATARDAGRLPPARGGSALKGNDAEPHGTR